MSFHQLEGFLDQVAHIVVVFLAVIDAIAQILVPVAQQVHHWQDLAIVGHEGLSDGIGRLDQQLDLFQRLDDYLVALSLEGVFDRNDQLGQYW